MTLFCCLSIPFYCFLIILFIYAWRMNKLDEKHGYSDQD